MIIACPACSRRFEVSDAAFSDGKGRAVKCGGCGHKWFQEPLSQSVLPASKRTISDITAQAKDRTRLWSWLFLFLLFFSLFPAMLVLMRQQVVEIWPASKSLFAKVGLPIILQPGYFQFQDTTWGLKKEEDAAVMRIKGRISYSPTKDVAHAVPNIQVSLYGDGKCTPQSWFSKIVHGTDQYRAKNLCLMDRWNVQPQDSLALPGEVIPFEIERKYPEGFSQPEHVVLDFLVA